MARQMGDPINGKVVIGDGSGQHYRRAQHYHVHHLRNEQRECNIQQIIDAGHVRTFTPDAVQIATNLGYIPCEYCLDGPHCGY
jgi:hypothetical protein